MLIRKIASLVAALSFIIMALTSFILYIVPQGRIAYWANWHLWGLTKEQWGNIHINTGILFLIALGFHVYYNWRLIISYLKDKAKNFKVFTKEFNIALLLTLLVILGTHFGIPPFSSILAISQAIKDIAAEKYGEPPYGHAELSSLKTFSKKMGIDLKESIERLKKAGYEFEEENQTILEISKQNKASPKQIYIAIKPINTESAGRIDKVVKLPDSPPPGTGKLTLADLCSRYNLNIKVVNRGLAKEGIKASEELTIKKIAEKNHMSSIDIYEKIKSIQLTQY